MSNLSHYTARVVYRIPGEDKTADGGRARRRQQYDTLKASGFSDKVFQFVDGDKAADAKAKAECEKYAKKWTDKTGVPLNVCLGFFM